MSRVHENSSDNAALYWSSSTNFIFPVLHIFIFPILDKKYVQFMCTFYASIQYFLAERSLRACTLDRVRLISAESKSISQLH